MSYSEIEINAVVVSLKHGPWILFECLELPGLGPPPSLTELELAQGNAIFKCDIDRFSCRIH